mmetsp:Transcript_14380/g.24594  ORF Transcript_14380/g.24594 Transcript_14380/m.24594 type:complete len:82 (-) Transcript_14380:316-561(-)
MKCLQSRSKNREIASKAKHINMVTRTAVKLYVSSMFVASGQDDVELLLIDRYLSSLYCSLLEKIDKGINKRPKEKKLVYML